MWLLPTGWQKRSLRHHRSRLANREHDCWSARKVSGNLLAGVPVKLARKPPTGIPAKLTTEMPVGMSMRPTRWCVPRSPKQSPQRSCQLVGKLPTGSHNIRARRKHWNQKQKPFLLPGFLQDPLLTRSNIVPSGRGEEGEFRAEKHKLITCTVGDIMK